MIKVQIFRGLKRLSEKSALSFYTYCKAEWFLSGKGKHLTKLLKFALMQRGNCYLFSESHAHGSYLHKGHSRNLLKRIKRKEGCRLTWRSHGTAVRHAFRRLEVG